MVLCECEVTPVYTASSRSTKPGGGELTACSSTVRAPFVAHQMTSYSLKQKQFEAGAQEMTAPKLVFFFSASPQGAGPRAAPPLKKEVLQSFEVRGTTWEAEFGAQTSRLVTNQLLPSRTLSSISPHATATPSRGVVFTAPAVPAQPQEAGSSRCLLSSYGQVAPRPLSCAAKNWRTRSLWAKAGSVQCSGQNTEHGATM